MIRLSHSALLREQAIEPIAHPVIAADGTVKLRRYSGDWVQRGARPHAAVVAACHCPAASAR